MGVKKTMRVGCNPFYPVPTGVDEDHRAEWFINRMAELGCRSAQPPGMTSDPDLLSRVKDLCREKDIEIDCRAAGVFGLAGPDPATARAQLLESIRVAQQAGTNIIRTGYGRLNVATSRYSRTRGLEEHLCLLVDNLKEAARIVEDQGMLLAVENHCDFSGRELAQVFEAVGSKSVGCALDTANGFTVFCDPNDDVRALAPHTITTHMKDMRVVDSRDLGYLQANGPLIPMLPIGCACGEGDVDLAMCVDEIAARSPHAEGIHLIIELGWDPVPEGKTQDEARQEQFHRSVDYLNALLS